ALIDRDRASISKHNRPLGLGRPLVDGRATELDGESRRLASIFAKHHSRSLPNARAGVRRLGMGVTGKLETSQGNRNHPTGPFHVISFCLWAANVLHMKGDNSAFIALRVRFPEPPVVPPEVPKADVEGLASCLHPTTRETADTQDCSCRRWIRSRRERGNRRRRSRSRQVLATDHLS